MDDDWDLEAVVRGCAATVTTSTDSTAADKPFPCYYDGEDSFDFHGLGDDRNDNFEGLQEIYREFCSDNPLPTTAAADVSMPVQLQPPPLLQPDQHTMQIQPPLRLNMQTQENVQYNVSPILGSPPRNFPTTISQPIRPRRRKNQQMKIVRQMTQEELSADSWAWRKYGQKPIKGSPYPRNYYRCSTSKGCAARKQVERSPNDPEIFVVSYSGEHTHPRPTHRSSFAGSTRSKLACPPDKSGGGSNTATLSQKGSVASSSSPVAGLTLSPATPSVEGEAAAQNGDVQMAEEEEEENIFMITNDLMNDCDDVFRGFQDPGDHSSRGGREFFSTGLL